MMALRGFTRLSCMSAEWAASSAHADFLIVGQPAAFEAGLQGRALALWQQNCQKEGPEAVANIDCWLYRGLSSNSALVPIQLFDIHSSTL